MAWRHGGAGGEQKKEKGDGAWLWVIRTTARLRGVQHLLEHGHAKPLRVVRAESDEARAAVGH